MENKFKIGDWIICRSATHPKAHRCSGVSEFSYSLNLPKIGSYSINEIGLDFATIHEIPLEYRKKYYYFY